MFKNKAVRIISLTLILLSVPLTVLIVHRETGFFNKAYYSVFGVRANLVINLTNSAKLEYFPWQFLAQGGEERTNMFSSVKDQLKSLNPEYIRIDHIYDFYDVVSRDGNNRLQYNWERFDDVINTLNDIGAKPFLSLSYMPDVLSPETEGLPFSWTEWSDVVKNTVEHVSGKNNLGISGVYYEVWNEPDLFGRFKTFGEKNYLDLYFYSVKGAESAKNSHQFKIGGPATSGLDKKWFDDFFNYAQKNHLRVDFYSWHRYSDKVQSYEEDIFNVLNWLLKYPQYSDVEPVITESGITSEVDPVNDQKTSAIFTLSVYTSMFQKIEKLFLFEAKDGPGIEKYWGRWGILTHEKFGPPEAKARFKALEFLRRAEGDFYPIYGQGTWVKALATQNNGLLKILVVNYDPYSKHTESVPITLVNMPFTEFTVRKTKFLGETSSYNSEAVNGNWKATELMNANTAVLLELFPR